MTLGVSYNPSYATVKDYTFSIVEGGDIVTQDGNEFTLNSNAEVGDTFKVRATLNGHSDIYAEKEITVVTSLQIENAIASTINYDTKNHAQPTIEVEAYDNDGEKLDTSARDFEYISKNPEIATVDADGKVTAHGHGKAEVEIRVAGTNKKLTDCDVYVMVVPAQIQVNNIKNDTLAYGKSEKLVLDVATSNSDYTTCASNVDYTFELLNEEGAVTETGATVAENTTTGIEFKKTGKVRVTITSDSSLNDAIIQNECQKVVTVNVNDGINIRTAHALRLAAESGNHTTYNIINDLILSETDNFNLNCASYSTDGVQACTFYGNTTINGNGYKISAFSLPLTESSNKDSFLQFNANRDNTQDAVFSVKLYDLEVLGCGNVGDITTAKFYYQGDKSKGEIHPNEKGYFENTYYRGININGNADANDNLKGTKGKLVCKDIVISNVKVSGFSVGLIIRHGVNALVSDCTIDQCSTNGIESDQNQITFHNLTIGQVGAFGLEITPDDMLGQDTDNPTGSAGLDYNETPTAEFTGYINSSNYNSGVSTIYMYGLSQQLKMSVPNLISAITGGTIQTILANDAFKSLDQSAKTQLSGSMSAVADTCLKNSDGDMNFFELIYIDVANGSYANYATKGNTENKFCAYTKTENMINLTDLLINVAQSKATQGSDWLGYKNYQYIIVDLDTGSANMGQTILVNQAYVDPTNV